MEELDAWKDLNEALSAFVEKSPSLTADERSSASAALCKEYARLTVTSLVGTLGLEPRDYSTRLSLS